MPEAALTEAPTKSPFLGFITRHYAWIIVGSVVLLSLFVRFRLREMPLERDEGEYAYAGQLMLEGVPPYKEAYNMKLPGTYAAYAAIMAIFGQTPSGIHVGVALVNAASIVLMFFLGRNLLDDVAGITAAVSFGLLSLSPSVLGLAGHATHFVVLPALAGTLLLLRALNPPRSAPQLSTLNLPSSAGSAKEDLPLQPFPSARPASSAASRRSTFDFRLFFAGLLFGLAFLMKQHGVFFGIFGGLYLLWVRITTQIAAIQDRKKSRRSRRGKEADQYSAQTTTDYGWSEILSQTAIYSAGCLLPYLFTCLLLLAAGVFPQFWFWTVSYAGKYASAVPMVYGAELFKVALSVVIGPNVVFWILPLIGAIVVWWEARLNSQQKIFLVVFLFCSLASVSVGFHFREHYFITLLPSLALLTGTSVSRAVHVLRHERTIELFLAVPVLATFIIGAFAGLLGDGVIWFNMPLSLAEAEVYRTTLFTDSAKIGAYIREHSSKNARVAVIGSEPEILFHSHRHSATGYIYAYPLMEEQEYAATMQKQMIVEIEEKRPEFFVYVNDDLSWLPKPNSDRTILEWWKNYWPRNLEVIMSVNVKEWKGGIEPREGANSAGDPKFVLLLKRKS